MAKIFQKGPAMKQVERNNTSFEEKKALRPGSKKAPIEISVQTEEREQELAAICADNNWSCIIEVNPDQDENIRSLEVLQNRQASVVNPKTPNRNDPCSCGSGKKYKKCCGAQS